MTMAAVATLLLLLQLLLIVVLVAVLVVAVAAVCCCCYCICCTITSTTTTATTTINKNNNNNNSNTTITTTTTTSVVTVNRTDTATFCYHRASSSLRCFWLKTAWFLCVLIFSYYTLNSLFLYISHKSSAVSLHLTVGLVFAHHQCLHSCYYLTASTHGSPAE